MIKKEFERIPPVFHPFLIKHGSDYIDYDEKSKQTVFDTTLEQVNLSFYIPNNRNKSITVRYDFIDEESAKEYIHKCYEGEEAEVLISELKEKTASFKQFIQDKGWKYAYSHAVEEWAYAWADVIFTTKQWSEETMREIAKNIAEFDKYMIDLYDKLH